MNKESLLEFIAKAHKHTYAAPGHIRRQYKRKIPLLPGHEDYDFEEGNWRYHDSYSGHFWAPGREVVFFQGTPVWSMAYQGMVRLNLTGKFIEQVYDFLKKALMKCDAKHPFRGPYLFEEGDFEYSFRIKGDYRNFTGREAIKHKDEEAFFQNVIGGLIK
jgi:hypothetical protein